MKKDAYYFSHDANAQDDPKIMVLIEQLGMEGVGIFWCLIEKLRAEKDYKLPLIVIGPFAKRWNTSKEKVQAVIKNYQLFIIDDQHFFSERLKNSMSERSEKARLSASYRWGDTEAIRSHNGSNTVDIRNDANKVKKSKVKESRVKYIPPTQPQVIEFFLENGFDKLLAEKAYAHYTDLNWKDSNGFPVKDWKQKIKAVWFKTEKKEIEYGSNEWKKNPNNWI